MGEKDNYFLKKITHELHVYLGYVFQKAEIIGYEHFKITLPFLDKHFDNIEIEFKTEEEIHQIEDGKAIYKLIRLECYIENLKEICVNERFKEICNGFGIEYDLQTGSIYKKFKFTKIGLNFIKFLEAVILISNL